MPKKSTRNAQGAGTIRQRKDGSWEARYTLGRDPGTGKQVQKSIYGKTQKEVLEKLQQVQNDIHSGVYREPSKVTVSQWMDRWLQEYKINVKQHTKAAYESHIRNQIKPALGAVTIQKLTPDHIQKFYNDLQRDGKSPKTIRNCHGVLHEALEKAVDLDYIVKNPSTRCSIPKLTKKEVQVMDDNKIIEFLNLIDGHRFEALFFVDLFTGMRQGEILGLTWDSIDFKTGLITIDKQLLKEKQKGGAYYLDATKHDKIRRIAPAPVVMDKLRERKLKQSKDRLRAGQAWENEWKLVFTDELGHHLTHHSVRDAFKRIAVKLGEPGLTFHSLRHSYAVVSLMSGDDPKTVQENLGHHTAAFTLDTYGHVTEQMRKASAARMEQYIQKIKKA